MTATGTVGCSTCDVWAGRALLPRRARSSVGTQNGSHWRHFGFGACRDRTVRYVSVVLLLVTTCVSAAPGPPTGEPSDVSNETIRRLRSLRLTLPANPVPLPDLLKALNEQEGVRVFCGLPSGKDPEDTQVTVSESNAWEAVKALAKAVGGRVADRDNAIIVALPPPGPRAPETPAARARRLLNALPLLTPPQRKSLAEGGWIAVDSLAPQLRKELVATARELRLTKSAARGGTDYTLAFSVRGIPAYEFLDANEPVVPEPCGRTLAPLRFLSEVPFFSSAPGGVFHRAVNPDPGKRGDTP